MEPNPKLNPNPGLGDCPLSTPLRPIPCIPDLGVNRRRSVKEMSIWPYAYIRGVSHANWIFHTERAVLTCWAMHVGATNFKAHIQHVWRTSSMHGVLLGSREGKPLTLHVPTQSPNPDPNCNPAPTPRSWRKMPRRSRRKLPIWCIR